MINYQKQIEYLKIVIEMIMDRCNMSPELRAELRNQIKADLKKMGVGK